MESEYYNCKPIRHSNENIQSEVNMLNAQSSGLKRKRKRSISKDKDENQTKILQNEDSLTESDEKDTHYIKCKSKNIKNREKTSQDEDSELTEGLQNVDITSKKVKCKKKDKFYVLLENDKNLKEEESENKYIYKVKKKNKIKNKTKISEDNDFVKKKTKKPRDKYNDFQEDTASTDTKQIVIEYKDTDNNLLTEVEDEENKAVGNVCEIKRSQDKINHSGEKNNTKLLLKENEDEDIQRESNNILSDVKEEYYSDVTYLAKKIKSSQKLNQNELTHLNNIRVQLEHDVLPQHMIETRAGSTIPTRKEIAKFEKITFIKKGVFSLEEDKIIAKNWKKFCKIHDWDVKKVQPFLHFRINNSLSYMRRAERRKFVQFLANGLPNRTLYSVYHRFKNLYENNLSRRYKPEEDQMIIDHLEHNPCLDETRKYVDLAKVLRRTRHSIWRRYRLLKKTTK